MDTRGKEAARAASSAAAAPASRTVAATVARATAETLMAPLTGGDVDITTLRRELATLQRQRGADGTVTLTSARDRLRTDVLDAALDSGRMRSEADATIHELQEQLRVRSQQLQNARAALAACEERAATAEAETRRTRDDMTKAATEHAVREDLLQHRVSELAEDVQQQRLARATVTDPAAVTARIADLTAALEAAGASATRRMAEATAGWDAERQRLLATIEQHREVASSAQRDAATARELSSVLDARRAAAVEEAAALRSRLQAATDALASARSDAAADAAAARQQVDALTAQLGAAQAAEAAASQRVRELCEQVAAAPAPVDPRVAGARRAALEAVLHRAALREQALQRDLLLQSTWRAWRQQAAEQRAVQTSQAVDVVAARQQQVQVALLAMQHVMDAAHTTGASARAALHTWRDACVIARQRELTAALEQRTLLQQRLVRLVVACAPVTADLRAERRSSMRHALHAWRDAVAQQQPLQEQHSSPSAPVHAIASPATTAAPDSKPSRVGWLLGSKPVSMDALVMPQQHRHAGADSPLAVRGSLRPTPSAMTVMGRAATRTELPRVLTVGKFPAPAPVASKQSSHDPRGGSSLSGSTIAALQRSNSTTTGGSSQLTSPSHVVVKSTGAGGSTSGGSRPSSSPAASPPVSNKDTGISAAVDTLLQLDMIQSEMMARSLRMRSETRALALLEAAAAPKHAVTRRGSMDLAGQPTTSSLFGITTATDRRTLVRAADGSNAHASSIQQKHATGFGQTREVMRSLDEPAGARTVSTVPTTLIIKDARILPALRKDFARALGLALDFASNTASADEYAGRMREAIRLLRETRDALHSVVGDCCYRVADEIGTLVKAAADEPGAVVARALAEEQPKGLPAASSTSGIFLRRLRAEALRIVNTAVCHEAGEATRLLMRARVFLGQFENRLELLAVPGLRRSSTSSAPPPLAGLLSSMLTHDDASTGRDTRSAREHAAALATGLSTAAPAAGRRSSAHGSVVSMLGTVKADENSVTRLVTQLAEEDARFVTGEASRVWEYYRITHSQHQEEREAAEAVAMVSVYRPSARGGSSTSRSAAGSSPMLRSHVPVSISSRQPPYDASNLDAPPGHDFDADAQEFLRYVRAFAAVVSASPPYVPAVSEEDVAAAVEQQVTEGVVDMVSTLVLEHNVPLSIARSVMTTLLWMLWRHVLLLYRHHAGPDVDAAVAAGTAKGARGGMEARPGFSARALDLEDVAPDLSAAAPDRRTADVHMSSVVFRLMEATAAVHLFPIA